MSGEALAQFAQRNCECLIPAGVQDQAEWIFEQPDLVAGVPAYVGGVRTRRPLRILPTQNIIP